MSPRGARVPQVVESSSRSHYSQRAARLRRDLLRDLLARTRADAAMFHEVLLPPHHATLLIANIIALGQPDVVRHLTSFNGVPYATFETDLGSLPPFGAFTSAGPQDVPDAVVEAVWAPVGIHDAIAYNGLDGARSTGQVAVFRTADHPPFASHDLRAARDLEPRVHRDLRAAARLARPPRERMVWMIDPTGGVQLRSASMDVPPAVAGHLQRLEARGDRSGSWFDGRQAFAATRMNGCAGAAWLVTATPLATLLIGPIAHLSQPQRQVAAIVARGATVAEAASALCRSENTVRSHLKAVYAACGIRTRAELVRMVDTWALPAPLDTTGSA